MSRMTDAHLTSLRMRHRWARAIGTFVETGTGGGETARLAAGHFAEVHTIELSAPLYKRAVEAGKRAHRNGSITYHLGDTREHLPRLCQALRRPVFFFLDAHWYRTPMKTIPHVAGYEEGLPLWQELGAIAARGFADVVCVDDVHAFGTERPTPEWLEVSLERIAEYFPGCREAVILGDQAVIYR